VTRYDSTPIEVAIFGGDPLVGRVLQLRLRDVGYRARFLDESLTADEPAELLGGAKLVLLGPRLSARCREAFLRGIRSAPATAGLPILELAVRSLNGARDGREEAVGLVRWPCRIEKLERKIEASLNGTYSR
jgi:hypothetical protein